jgi:hypothetical protein
MVADEAEMIVRRSDAIAAKKAVLLQLALMTIPQQGMKKEDLKKRLKAFSDQIQELTED